MSLRRPAKNQPENFEFNSSSLEAANKIVSKYPNNKQQSAVMALLYIAQKQNNNWIPLAAMKYIAKFLDMPYIKVYEVATFYTMYNLSPVGKYFVQVCTTTPCMIRGANKLVEASAPTLGTPISWGPTSTTNFIRNRISTVDLVRTDKLVGAPGLETAGGEAYLLVAADYTWNDVADPGPDTITTNSDEQANISVGDVVAGAGVAAGTTVASIDATTITLSNFSGTGTGDLQFYPPNRDVYNLVLTGGSINFENNISYLTPEELGIVNAPIGNITGSRAISGNITCYLDNDVSSSKSGELFADLVSDTDTVRNTFDLNINIGGTAAPSLKFSLPTAHLEVPVINVEDLLTLDVAFHGQVSAGNVDSTNEATITYKGE